MHEYLILLRMSWFTYIGDNTDSAQLSTNNFNSVFIGYYYKEDIKFFIFKVKILS